MHTGGTKLHLHSNDILYRQLLNLAFFINRPIHLSIGLSKWQTYLTFSILENHHVYLADAVHVSNLMHLRQHRVSLVPLVWAFNHMPSILLSYLRGLWSIPCIIGDMLHLPMGVDPCHLHPALHQCGFPIWACIYSNRNIWSSWAQSLSVISSYGDCMFIWWYSCCFTSTQHIDGLHITFGVDMIFIMFPLFITINNLASCSLIGWQQYTTNMSLTSL